MSPTTVDRGAAGVEWTARAGAWLGIGTSPGALVLGASIAGRSDGTVGVVGIAVGLALMAVLLNAQGLIGVVPPVGDGTTLSGATDRYLEGHSVRLLHLLMAGAMVGWFGFNVGLGGAALAAFTGLPQPLGPLLLGLPLVAIALAGMARWNGIAVVTTTCALVLVGVVTARLAAPGIGVALDAGGPRSWMADAGALVGYVAVFSLRAPDFSHGLRSRSDLARCVALLVTTTALVVVAGIGLQRGTGSTDVVAALTDSSGAGLGNVLLAIAVVAATFTTLYSGRLALQAVVPIRTGTAILVVAVPGLVLAMVRFDRALLPWLAVLAAVLPPLLVPMSVEATRRRRGLAPRRVVAWSWLPGAVIALVLASVGLGSAALAGLATTVVLTALRHALERSA